jgi:hypothetical protein
MANNDISLMSELKLLITMPIYWLIGIIIIFMVLMNNLSIINLLVFVLIYAIITRLHLYSDLPSPRLEMNNKN